MSMKSNCTDYKQLGNLNSVSPGSVGVVEDSNGQLSRIPIPSFENMSVQTVPNYQGHIIDLQHNVPACESGRGHFSVANAYATPCTQYQQRNC